MYKDNTLRYKLSKLAKSDNTVRSKNGQNSDPMGEGRGRLRKKIEWWTSHVKTAVWLCLKLLTCIGEANCLFKWFRQIFQWLFKAYICSDLVFFFFCMDELGNIFNISGDIWRKNELFVKQVVCFDAVSVALTVYTGYKYVCVYISWNWKRVLVWICLFVKSLEMAPYFVKTSIPDVFLPQKT